MISDENHLDNEISIEKHIFRQNDYPGRLIKRIIEENVTFSTVTRLNLFKVIYHNSIAKPNHERTDHCFKECLLCINVDILSYQRSITKENVKDHNSSWGTSQETPTTLTNQHWLKKDVYYPKETSGKEGWLRRSACC